MNKQTKVQSNKCTNLLQWPQDKDGNLIYLTAVALSDSLTPTVNYYKEAIAFMGRTIKSRRRLGLSSAGYEQDLLDAIDILTPVGLGAAARKQADELSVNR